MANILIVDDDSDIQYVLTECLKDDGHTIDSAANGKVAIKLFATKSYDLILTDIVMPEMDGFEFIPLIKNKFPNLKIIAMTGGSQMLNSKLLLEVAQALRVQRAIAKPLVINEVLTAVNEVLHS